MTDLRKIFLLTNVPIFVIGLLFFLSFVKVNSTEVEIVEYILPLRLNGQVVDKQIDYKNSVTKSVIIKDKNENWAVLYDSFFGIRYLTIQLLETAFTKMMEVRVYL